MANDPFDQLLSLEDSFYKEGYEAGLADGEHAGHVEGKIFGIEKGYEKALELGRLHGRGLVWQTRLANKNDVSSASHAETQVVEDSRGLLGALKDSRLPKNIRLTRHIEGLLTTTGSKDIATDNSDESVTEFDDRIAKAQAKAKVIAAIVNEPLNLEVVTDTKTGIEDARGLNARH